MSKLIAKEYKRFEDIKEVRKDGSEFWSARKLSLALDYIQWRNFQKVIQRAMIACENSGHNILDDFAEVSKIVEAGAAKKPVLDYELTRYACYLIVQNGDPRKEVIAFAMIFSITHRCANFTKAGFCSMLQYLSKKNLQVICPEII